MKYDDKTVKYDDGYPNASLDIRDTINKMHEIKSDKTKFATWKHAERQQK